MAPRSLPPQKKRKVSVDDSQIKLLESAITDAVAKNDSLNPLADLLDLVHNAKDAPTTSKAIYAAYRVFVVIIANGKLGLGGDNASKVVKSWLLDQLNTYVEFLGGLLKDEEKTLRISALQILFSLQKHLSTSYSTSTSTSSSKPKVQPQFHISHFKKIVSALLLCPPSKRSGSSTSDDGLVDLDVGNLFYEKWFSVNDDIRWFFLRDSATLLNANLTHPTLPLNLLIILEKLTTFPTEPSELNSWWVSELGTSPPKPKRTKPTAGDPTDSDQEETLPKTINEGQDEDEDDWRKYFEDEPIPTEPLKNKTPGVRLHQMTIHQSLHSLASHKAVFTRTWLTLLPRLSNVYKNKDRETEKLVVRVLNIMHRGILPHLTRPVLVMDWVGNCVDYGGSVGLLALNALFILMKDYNLDYPSFYTRLYAFLDRDVLHQKYRARFFRMTELFLSSTHLPIKLLASFVKRLSRLSLNAPPAAIVMVIPFVYNLMKKNPKLMVLVHNVDVDVDFGDDFEDPFNAEEPNPTMTNALSSSLWELVSMRNHYHTTVSTLAKVFGEPFTKLSYPLEDFLDHTYATLFDTEANRKIKREPALAMDLPSNKGFIAFPTQLRNQDQNEEDGDGDGDGDEVMVIDGQGNGSDLVTELWSFV